ncbi:hypothetical protein [Thalassotalea montiporae]
MYELYREEAIKNKYERNLGSVVVTPSVKSSFVVYISLCIFVLAIFIVCTYRFKETVYVSGKADSENVFVFRSNNVSGTVNHSLEIGQPIKKGQFLFAIIPTNIAELKAKKERLSEALLNKQTYQAKLDEKYRSVFNELNARAELLKIDIENGHKQINLQTGIIDSQEKSISKMEVLSKDGYIGSIQLEGYKQDKLIQDKELIEIKSKKAILERQLNNIQLSLKTKQSDYSLVSTTTQNSIDEIHAQIQQINRNISHQVFSSRDGVIGRISKRNNSDIGINEKVITIVSEEEDVYLALEIPSNIRSKVNPGTQVEILVNSGSINKKFFGIVKSISRLPTSLVESPFYLANVELTNNFNERDFFIGMDLQARLILNERTLVDILSSKLSKAI